MFISNITSRLRNLNIDVVIDSRLLTHLDCEDVVSVERTIPINLYKLVFSIGLIQTRRFAPSNRQKFSDFSDIIEKLHSNTPDFKVKINEIRGELGSEVLGKVSEDIAVGISVAVTEILFKVKSSTIVRIYGNDKRPDWKCQTIDNRVIIIESKGASSVTTSNRQEGNALIQKNRREGDIKVASLTVLNESNRTSNRYLDPPIEPDNTDPFLQQSILRAGHYSSIFSFLGHSLLSRYFSHMRKRLLGSITDDEQQSKNESYDKLMHWKSQFSYDGGVFSGGISKVDDFQYLFIGVDTSLISYEGFKSFNEYEDDKEECIESNEYILFKNGILIIEISNLDYFIGRVDVRGIEHYQERNTISDIDGMHPYSFEKYIKYILESNDVYVEKNTGNIDVRFDFLVAHNGKRVAIELKLYKKKHYKLQGLLIHLEEVYSQSNVDKIIIITNVPFKDVPLNQESNISIIDRGALKYICEDNSKILQYLY